MNRLEEIRERWPVIYLADIVALLAVAEAARPFARCYAPITDEAAQRIVGPCGTCWGCQLRAALAPLTEEESRG